MFGNRLGWGISGTIIVVVVLLLVWLHRKGTSISPPGPIGKNAAAYTGQLPVSPRSLATWMTEDRDATGTYAELLRHVEGNLSAYQGYVYDGKFDTPQHAVVMKGIAMLIEASRAKNAKVFAPDPGRLINYNRQRELEVLTDVVHNLVEAVNRVGLQHQTPARKEYAKAREIFQALFSLGTHMYEERLTYQEYYQARLALVSALSLAALPDTPAELKKQFTTFDKQHKDNFLAVTQTLLAPSGGNTYYLWALDPSKLRYWCGDVAAVATNAPDRMWRVEAIRALGLMKYNGRSTGDQIGARKLLERLAQDQDPIIRLAADKARALTREDFRKLNSPDFFRLAR